MKRVLNGGASNKGTSGYTFQDIPVGGSRMYNAETFDMHRVRCALQVFKKANGGAFYTRKVVGGVRVWRTE